MAAFCLVRFDNDPVSGDLYVQTKMTWGDGIRHLYPDYWGWTSEVKFMAKRSVARPVIMEIIG